jgi:hypothetical protein
MQKTESKKIRRSTRWFVEPNGRGDAFNACFEELENGKPVMFTLRDGTEIPQGGIALHNVSLVEAEAHVDRAHRSELMREHYHALVETMFDEIDWKKPTKRFRCASEKYAREAAEALTYFCGGAEVRQLKNGWWSYGSAGYYFYACA